MTTAAPRLADPRPAYAAATARMIELLTAVTEDQLDAPTPCSEFDVHLLMRHIVGTGRRSRALAAGEDALAVNSIAETGDVAAYADAVGSAIDDWSDDARLAAQVTVPWGQVPFGPVVSPRPDAGPTERLANWSGRVSDPWVSE